VAVLAAVAGTFAALAMLPLLRPRRGSIRLAVPRDVEIRGDPLPSHGWVVVEVGDRGRPDWMSPDGTPPRFAVVPEGGEDGLPVVDGPMALEAALEAARARTGTPS